MMIKQYRAMSFQRLAKAVLLTLPLLAGCASQNAKTQAVAYYDFQGAVAKPTSVVSGTANTNLLRSVEVIPSSWMASNAMYYQLAYADVSKREQFSQSRWTSPPAELLQVYLQRHLLGDISVTTGATSAATTGKSVCRLKVELDDLRQVFDSAQQSRLVLGVRATVLKDQALTARKVLDLSAPAGADAQSGVAASATVLGQLAAELSSLVASGCN